jgi:hypothetical protein
VLACPVLSRELSAYAQNVRPGSKCLLRARRNALTLARSVSSRLMLGADKLRTKLEGGAGTAASGAAGQGGSGGPPSSFSAAATTTNTSPGAGAVPGAAKVRSVAVFGVPLEEAVRVPTCPYDIPAVVEHAIQYLEAQCTHPATVPCM